jgi:hypothetical protein
MEALRDEARADRERAIGEHVEQRAQRYFDRLQADERDVQTKALQQEQMRAWLRGFDADDP